MSRSHFRLKHRLAALAVAFGALAFQVTGAAHAAAYIITVNSAADTATAGDGQCTLREAIANANAEADTTNGDCVAPSGFGSVQIVIDPDEAITLTSQLPAITGIVEIVPGTLNETATIQAGTCDPISLPGHCRPAAFRILHVAADAAVTITDLTLSYGRCAGACEGRPKDGGAILNEGSLTYYGGGVTHNLAAGQGGGIYNAGTLQTGTDGMHELLLKNNSAGKGGGAVASSSTGSVYVTSACLGGNSQPALLNLDTASKFASMNWWGSPTGPGGAGSDGISGSWDTSGWKNTIDVRCGGGAYTLSAATAGPTSLTISWTDAATDEGTYSLERSIAPHGWTIVATGSPDITSLTDTTAAACNTRYTYRVLAQTAQDGAYSGSITATTRVCAPTRYTPRTNSTVTNPDFEMTWRKVRGATGYHFQLSDDPGFASPYSDQTDNFTGVGFAHLPFGVWYWHVASTDANGDSAYGPTLSYEWTLNRLPRKNAVLNNGVVRFIWQAMSGKTYLLRINDETAHTVFYQTPSPLSKPTFTVDKTAPLPSGDYSWQVNIDGGSSWTLARNFHVN